MFKIAGLVTILATTVLVGSWRQSERSELALVGGTVYVTPDQPPIRDATVVIADGLIQVVGPRDSTAIPPGATTLDCAGLFITAGFQNSHTHFTEDKWVAAASQPATSLTSELRAMLTRYGVTTVVDTGSDPFNTIALRRRIESGEVPGPRVLTAGTPLYPPDAVPYYVKEALPPHILKLLPQPRTPDEAAGIIRQSVEAGTDVVKLFTGSWAARGQVVPMPLDVATRAVAEAHRLGRLVFTHPSNVAGLEVALTARVDILAHAVEDTDGLTPEHLRRMAQQKMSLVPTLKLFGGSTTINRAILEEVRDYARNGGQILFGTDVGYLTDYDPSDELDAMARAGLSWQEILASLTTNPAARFGESARRGRIVKGLDGDLVVLGSDPAAAVRAFADVRRTIRAGRVIYP